ncbi:MAG: flagellar motor switch protein FliN [Clostridia bacterium]|nr:MAG: flagellar motor switch protein FliN [Clostridia bacterium]
MAVMPEGVAIKKARFQPLQPVTGVAPAKAGIDLLKEVEVTLTAVLGEAKMTVREILEIEPGSLIKLDKLAGDRIDLLVNERLVGSGEVVIINESLSIRINALEGVG